MQNEQGIIFKGDMIRALLAWRKKRTRRLNVDYWMGLGLKPGDRLWARETWEQVHPCQIAEGRFSIPGEAGIPGPPGVNYRVIYRADGEYPRKHFIERYPYRTVCQLNCCKPHIHPEEAYHGWASPIFMPRWASRIILEVTAPTRKERLKDITPEEAVLEGAHIDELGRWTMFDPFPDDRMYHSATPTAAFAMYINYIHGGKNWHRKPSGLWSQNPEVAVISFDRVEV